MRRLALLSALLFACGSEDPPAPAVQERFAWAAPEGATVHGAAALPGGGFYVHVGGDATRGLFLSDAGEELASVDFASLCDGCEAVVPAQPLVVGESAFFGPVAGGPPLFQVEGPQQRIRHLPLLNPRNLPMVGFAIDGRTGTAMANGTQMLLAGERLVELSIEGIVTEVHPTPLVRDVAHVDGDVYSFVEENGLLGGWRDRDRAIEVFDPPVAVAAVEGGGGFTVLALRGEGAVDLFLYGNPIVDLKARFDHAIELSAAPDARRILVGVRDEPLPGATGDATDGKAARLPAPGTALVLAGDGEVLGRFEAPSPIVAVHLDRGGRRGVIAHRKGVIGLELR